jgi:hypothetical protein
VLLLAAGGGFVAMRMRGARAQREQVEYAGQVTDIPLPGLRIDAFARPAPEVQAQIVGVSGEHAGKAFAFGDVPLVIGAGVDSDVRLPRGRNIASKHAMLWVRDGKITLWHTGGRCPTICDGRPVDWLVLEQGDVFLIGANSYRVELTRARSARVPALTDA